MDRSRSTSTTKSALPRRWATSSRRWRRKSGIQPPVGFADRVMAAVAHEPLPQPVRAFGAALVAGRLGAALRSIGDAWRVGTGGSTPLWLRAQALALVLVVAIGSLAVAGGATVGAIDLLSANQSPGPSPTAPCPANRSPSEAPSSPSPSRRARARHRVSAIPNRTETPTADRDAQATRRRRRVTPKPNGNGHRRTAAAVATWRDAQPDGDRHGRPRRRRQDGQPDGHRQRRPRRRRRRLGRSAGGRPTIDCDGTDGYRGASTGQQPTHHSIYGVSPCP